jgi:hypothetical protein
MNAPTMIPITDEDVAATITPGSADMTQATRDSKRVNRTNNRTYRPIIRRIASKTRATVATTKAGQGDRQCAYVLVD